MPPDIKPLPLNRVHFRFEPTHARMHQFRRHLALIRISRDVVGFTTVNRAVEDPAGNSFTLKAHPRGLSGKEGKDVVVPIDTILWGYFSGEKNTCTSQMNDQWKMVSRPDRKLRAVSRKGKTSIHCNRKTSAHDARPFSVRKPQRREGARNSQ